jgi:hypothetical protein
MSGVYCTGRLEDEHTCGRPLGMRMGKDGYLVVADTYKGLFKVNVATGMICCTCNICCPDLDPHPIPVVFIHVLP